MSESRHGPLPVGPGGARFLGGLTHELRTPLTSILMMSELLAENTSAHLDEREVRYARNVHEAASDLLELVEQAGEIGRIAAGRVRVAPSELALAELARHLGERLAPAGSGTGSAVAVELDPGAPASVRTDPQLLERIVAFLVESATKAAGGRPVRVLVGRPAGDGSGAAATTVVVSDSGPPVPEAERELLFEPFGVAGSRSSRRFGGTGLALPLARALAVLLGATLEVAEADGRPATVLALPLV